VWPLDDITLGILSEHFEGSVLNRGVTELDPAPAGSGDGMLQLGAGGGYLDKAWVHIQRDETVFLLIFVLSWRQPSFILFAP